MARSVDGLLSARKDHGMGITIGIDVGTVSTKCALFGAAERLRQIAASGDAVCSVFDYAPEPEKACLLYTSPSPRDS